ncbi:MAG: hypothetical protein KAT09_07185, partial [Candidatus Aegiribacteria sp.]|nr:hypothetical protein [Candidatus Aegiribacteria sp.]
RIRTIEIAGSRRATATDDPATITAYIAFIGIPEPGLMSVTASVAQRAATSKKKAVVRIGILRNATAANSPIPGTATAILLARE